MKKWKKALLIVGIILAVLIAAAVCGWFYLFGNLKQVELDVTELGIETVEHPPVTDEAGETIVTVSKTPIKNIAVFGLSVTETYGIDTDRSDMIMIVSISPDENRVCVTSILRDSKVPIEGHDPQKINGAYKFGGAPLAIKTLNQNFHLDIADYVTVNFENMIEIVDSFGGVEIEVTADEAEFINYYSTSGQVHEGVCLMNGEQALLYASIRKIDSDYYRASRQQIVLMKLLAKVQEMPKVQYPIIVNKLMKCLETSLSYSDIMGIINSVDLGSLTIVTNTIPDINYQPELWGGIDETGSWVYVFDIEKAAYRLHKIIYYGSPN